MKQLLNSTTIIQTDLPNQKWGNSSGAAGVSGQLANAITLAFLLFILFVVIRVREALRQDNIAEEEGKKRLITFKKKFASKFKKAKA